MSSSKKSNPLYHIKVSEKQFKNLVLNDLSNTPELMKTLEGRKLTLGVEWHTLKLDDPSDAIATVNISEIIDIEDLE